MTPRCFSLGLCDHPDANEQKGGMDSDNKADGIVGHTKQWGANIQTPLEDLKEMFDLLFDAIDSLFQVASKSKDRLFHILCLILDFRKGII